MDAKELANTLMVEQVKLVEVSRALWSRVHNLTEWECGDCGHGGAGEELDCNGDGSPLCPWCSNFNVRPRAQEQDVPDAVDGREAIVPIGSNEHEAFFASEFSAWLNSMQADGYHSDDIARTVKAECDALIGGR